MKTKLIRIVLTVVLLVLVGYAERHFNLPLWQLLLLYLVPYLIIGYDVLIEAVEGLLEGNALDENFLMSVATIGALSIGFLPNGNHQFLEGVFVMLFFQVGEMFEHYAKDRTRDSISDLMDIRPDRANVERNGVVQTVDPTEIAVNEVVLIKPGEKIPLDGVIVEGSSSLNTVALTGESMPRNVSEGDSVLSGCVNVSGLLKMKVTKNFGESTASKIIHLVEEASENKSKNESFIRRFAIVYTPIVVGMALVLAFLPPFFYDSYGSALSTWLYRALTFLVVSCPCALVISVPLSFFCGIGGASQLGILIKGGNYMEALARTKTVVFDKTGTLTQGIFEVEAIHPNGISKEELLSCAAHVNQFSTHPIAVALRKTFGKNQFTEKVDHITEVAGQGIQAKINGKTISAGNKRMMESIDANLLSNGKESFEHTGTVIHVANDENYMGHIVISDKVKADSKEAITALKNIGVSNIVMLTGDRQEEGVRVAETLGLDKVYTELLPTDKVLHVEKLLNEKAKNSTLAFVGDGINDAPVLARADVGIAMGALGSDAAIEAADVVLMDDKPSKIAKAIEISRRTIGIAQQNTIFAIGIKVAVLILSTFGLTTMGMAVFADVGVMVLTVMNASRALSVKSY
ncbi:cadmium-exporting ATPase [Prevotella disiens JCM 6334 = ATCC 29426]|uniref:P-type Zn(2+) transporter n=2 Tax=Prevotella disiens TaxID=28130 RepID=A0A379DV46_9BACT|nr:heavy metal translocating P-type ATPase [Prevotella disiens]ERJ76039.1 cadmium-exporting ATPase [Prevotella disiens JCM 6334 = ATCC 29426]SUB84366.1 Cadmium, zinc and cobalt-transporting ATPase [Prevotella disiens]